MIWCHPFRYLKQTKRQTNAFRSMTEREGSVRITLYGQQVAASTAPDSASTIQRRKRKDQWGATDGSDFLFLALEQTH